MSLRSLLAGALALALSATISTAGPTTGTLKGHVLGWDHLGASQTQVRIVRWHFFAQQPVIDCDKVTYTDDDGNFSMQLEPGVYDVFISRDDSDPVAKKVEIIAAKNTVFSPKLKLSRFVKFIE
jgi:hypothetical protein